MKLELYALETSVKNNLKLPEWFLETILFVYHTCVFCLSPFFFFLLRPFGYTIHVLTLTHITLARHSLLFFFSFCLIIFSLLGLGVYPSVELPFNFLYKKVVLDITLIGLAKTHTKKKIKP